MSFFNEANKDELTIAPERAASGKLVGFLDAFKTGWEAQTRASAQYGIENEMRTLDIAQVDAMRKAGVENVPALGIIGMDKYLETARFQEDGGDPTEAKQLLDYDKRIADLQIKYPMLNLKTSGQMWSVVKDEAQRWEAQSVSERHTWGGAAGAFFGGAVGGINPNSDPLNALTLGWGGAGKTILGRIGIQAGSQGVVEGINQITGVQEERRLLGLEHGIGDAFSRIGAAAVGGAALQGAGELVAGGARYVPGVRRWFRSTELDPAPPPSPEVLGAKPPLPPSDHVPPTVVPPDEGLAASKLVARPDTYVDNLHAETPFAGTKGGRQRTILDLDHVDTRLNDWTSGERPWEITPKTDTAITLPESDFTAPDLSKAVERTTVDATARRIDPQTFARYDNAAQRKQTYQRWIDELVNKKDADVQAGLDTLDAQIRDATAKAEQETGKRAAKLRADARKLEEQKVKLIQDAEAAAKETPDMARVRRQLVKEDQNMRDLAPLVSRAYARAQGKWTNTAADRAAISEMMRTGSAKLPDPQLQRVAASLPETLPVPETLADKAPLMRQAVPYTESPKPGDAKVADATVADAAARIVAENVKVIDDAVERYRSTLDSAIKEAPNGEIEIIGQKYKLNLDKDIIHVPNEEGTGSRELTIRQLLEENKLDEEELKAVSSCSLRKTS